MSNKLEYKIVVTENGNEIFSDVLSDQMVSSIVSDYPDIAESVDFFTVASKHPASAVRESLAYKDNLPTEVLQTLSADQSLAVLRNLFRNDTFKKFATQELLENLIPRDLEIAQEVASSLNVYEEADSDKLAAILLAHPDPSVAMSLAAGWATPKKILKNLLKHPDPWIVRKANETLASY